MNTNKPTMGGLILKSVILHTVTYFLAGWIAFSLFQYPGLFAIPALAGYMRPVDSIWVGIGPLFQPVRGFLFALALYPLWESLFNRKYGWLVTWLLLVIIGILSTYGPTPGSIEGLLYTQVPLAAHLRGLPEVLVQSLVYSVVLFYWINHPEKRWLNWLLGIMFCILMTFPVLGLLVR